jgi:serine/threonine protein kinase/CRP-like cAMP-binding protein
LQLCSNVADEILNFVPELKAFIQLHMESFGRYKLLRRIAVGGMAEIFLAQSASLDGFEKNLVIKRIRSDLSRNEQFSSMFLDEARISITFNHPNLIQVFDFGKINDCYYLAMELVAGCDLDAVIEMASVQNQGLHPGLALLVTEAICHGLEYAHTKRDKSGEALGVVHRDISPANVILGYEGAIKVADFGIAASARNVTEEQPGVVIGKQSYMAPEQARGEEVDRRGDVYCVSIVLWEILLGRAAFDSDTQNDFYQRITKAIIKPPSTYRPDLPSEIDELVMKGLSPNQQDRYASAREMAEAVRRCQVGLYPEVSIYTLQSYLAENQAELAKLQDELAGAEPLQPHIKHVEKETNEQSFSNDDNQVSLWSPSLREAVKQFEQQPSLWTLYRMGRMYEAEDKPDYANVIWCGAAAKFAQQGLLAESLLCARARLGLVSFEACRDEIALLPGLVGVSDDDLFTILSKQIGTSPIAKLLLRLLHRETEHAITPGAGTPLLSAMDGTSFADLAHGSKLHRYGDAQLIVSQGDVGKSMFLIGGGRVLVYGKASDGSKMYLSSLMSGDFFGENSFFTGAPRSANVESLQEAEVFEIDQPLYDKVMYNDPQASRILLKFYKDRIVDTILAQNQVFGVLSTQERRGLIDAFELKTFGPGQEIIREGEVSSQIYIIKTGQAQVIASGSTGPQVLSTIGPGTLFGEVGVLRQVPRTAAVHASLTTDALELEGEFFRNLLKSRPEVSERVEAIISGRVRANMSKVLKTGITQL